MDKVCTETQGAGDKMTIYQIRWQRRVRAENILSFGDVCAICFYHFNLNDHKIENADGRKAEFHHLIRNGDGLKGASRPMTKRLLAPKKNPGIYVLLCRDCHRTVHYT